MANIIFSSLNESFSAFYRNKKLILLLFILQTMLFASVSYANFIYGAKIMENEQAIFDYLGRLEMDEKQIADNILQQKSILGDDPLLISRNFEEMKHSMRIYLAWLFGLLLLFTSLSWMMSHKVTGSKSKMLSRMFITSFSFLAVIFLLFLWMLNISLIQASSGIAQIASKYLLFLVFAIILAYFMIVSLALPSSIKLKELAEKTLIIGIRKAHYILAAFFINILFFALLGLLFAYFAEKNIIIMFLSIFLILLNFVFSRIFIINVIRKLS